MDFLAALILIFMANQLEKLADQLDNASSISSNIEVPPFSTKGGKGSL